jgi:hypothetical protein
MKTRQVLTGVAVALLLTPVLLSVGVFVVIPLGLVLFAALPFAVVAALPALLVSASRDTAPGGDHGRRAIASTVSYTR